MSLRSSLRKLLPFPRREKASSAATAEEQLFQYLRSLIRRSDLLAEGWERYEAARRLSGDRRLTGLLEAYALLEDAIVRSAPPAVARALSREELRAEIRAHVDLRRLDPAFALLYFPEPSRTFRLLEYGVRELSTFLLGHVGIAPFRRLVSEATLGTMLEGVVVSDAGINFEPVRARGETTSMPEIIEAFRRLFRALYAEIIRSFGERSALGTLTNLFATIRGRYDYELVARFLEAMPEGLFERERMTFLSREELERRAEQAVRERLRREAAEKQAAELRAIVEDLKRTKAAMLNLLEDERALEAQLREERDQLQAILASMVEGLLVVDRSGLVLLVNRAAETLLEVRADDVVGRSVNDILTFFRGAQELAGPDDLIARVLTSGEKIVMELSDNIFLRIPSGRRFPITLAVTPLQREGIRGAVVLFTDITEQKKLDEAKTGFISTASHQLRTPLTSIRWFTEILLGEDLGQLNEQQRHFLTRIYQSVERMVRLVNLLLQIARVEAGRVMIAPIPVDLKDLTNDVVQSLKDMFEGKRQVVKILADPDPPPAIPMDLDVIWQVIQNLLSNASRYSPPEAPITVTIRRLDATIEYSVHDRGIGIPKDQQSRIFQKFFRATNAVRLVPEGSGLGLVLVKYLVEDWGGTIRFQSEPGQGTTFTFTVPLEGMKPRAGEVKLAT